MKLNEMLKMIDNSTNIRITVDGEYVVAHYNGTAEYDGRYDDYEVNNMFATTINDMDWMNFKAVEKPYISIDVTPTYYVEIWRTPDYEDWAKVNVDKKTGHITDIQASEWDWAGEMTREEAQEMMREDGYTEFDPDDTFKSYEEWDDYVSCGGQYEYL